MDTFPDRFSDSSSKTTSKKYFRFSLLKVGYVSSFSFMDSSSSIGCKSFLSSMEQLNINDLL